jgi:hypothetical protein
MDEITNVAKITFDTATFPTTPLHVSDLVAPGQRAATENRPALPPSAPIAETSLPHGKMPSLLDVDTLFGPLRFGEVSISRRELLTLGAKVSGQDITAANTYFAQPDQAFIDALELNPAKVAARMLAAGQEDSHLVATAMFELATLRSDTAAPLLQKMAMGTHATQMDKLSGVLNAVQRLEIRDASQLDQTPGWVDRHKSRAMSTMGAGMQAYGLYSAYVGTIDALKKGDWLEAGINAGGGAAELASLGLEYALTKTGEAMIRNGAQTFEQFSKTISGSRLVRGSGLIASVLTLPFDVYTAVKSFSEAGKVSGKKAQDLYVTGGLSVFSAGLSLALGVATLMGFQAAGPIGLAAAALMIVGAQIYAAARVVDDIDDYIELTTEERWRSGWFAFTGQNLDAEVMDRFKLAKTYDEHLKALKKRSISWLENDLKDTIETIVTGRVSKSLQPTRLYRFSWDEAAGELPYVTVNQPVIEDTDDHYDARNGFAGQDANVTFGHMDSQNKKGVLWQLGGGKDTIQGVTAKPNSFTFGQGRKHLRGGDANDTFAFQDSQQTLYGEDPTVTEIGWLRGEGGTDLLWLQGKDTHRDYDATQPRFAGYTVDLENGRMGLRPVDTTQPSVLHSYIDSFEKVETLAGAANRVYGTANAEVIGANGNDVVQAGGGDDQISVRGTYGNIDGGSGSDTFLIDAKCIEVTIVDDGQESSTVYLGVPLEYIQSWLVRDNALVINSLRVNHPGKPRRELSMARTYQTNDGKRTLRNDKWLFITQDGYYLQADLPQEIDGLGEHTVNAIVISPGTPKKSPWTLNNYQTVPAGVDSFYYVSADTAHATLNVVRHDKVAQSTVYIDHDSQDISEVRAHYHVEMTQTEYAKRLYYKDVYFTVIMRNGASLLSLHGGIVKESLTTSSVSQGVLAPDWKTLHEFTLVMRDGTSYSLDYPKIDYQDDTKTQGYKVAQSRASLHERDGKYQFVKPSVDKRSLKNSPQRIDIQPTAHRSHYHLEGRSSNYEIHPSGNVSLQLSTAAADASTSGSSTWVIYTGHLERKILRSHLSIKGNLLKIDSIHVQLPDSDDPSLPVETVDVIVTSGNRYRVNNLFETIGLLSVDASAYSSIDAIATDIKQQKEQQELEDDETPVSHLYLQDNPSEKLHYNAQTATWGITRNPDHIVDEKQLRIGIAAYQLPNQPLPTVKE